MSIRRLQGRSDVLGRVDVRFPEGLVAVIGRDGRSGAALVRFLRHGLSSPARDGADDRVRVVVRGGRPGVTAGVEDLAALRVGPGRGEAPAEVLEAAAGALAGFRGGSRLAEAVTRVVRERGGREGPALLAQVDPSALRERIDELEAGTARLLAAERKLRELRADHAEVAGDLEVATMDWLRERQDAETHLQAYRDRARELKARLTHLEEAGSDAPCPTCGRVLLERFDEVVAELREEWESVVQDGSWWKRRREQLEQKPEPLRELEGRSLRLQAAIEEWAERVDRARARDHELRSARERLRQLESGGGADGVGPGVAAPPDTADPAPAVLKAMTDLKHEMVAEARALILEASCRLVLELSGGRILGMTRREEGHLALEGVGGRLSDPTAEDRAAAVVAIRLAAAAALLDEDPALPGTLVVGAPFDRMDEESRLRAVHHLAGLGERVPQILLVTRGRAAEQAPEVFDAVLELDRSGADGTTTARPLTAGVGRIRLA